MEKSSSLLDSLYEFRIRPEFVPLEGFPFYVEFFWNFEKAPKSQASHLISQISSIEQNSLPPNSLKSFLDYFFCNKDSSESGLGLLRCSESHQIVGFISMVAFIEYFLPNNNTKENEFNIASFFGIVSKDFKLKGTLALTMSLLVHMFSIKHRGKNCVFLDCSINPISYKFVTQNGIIYPSYYREMPRAVQDFVLRLMKKYDYVSLSEEKRFVVEDQTIEDIDRERWRRGYSKLSNDMKYFIDQTELRPGYGLLFFTFTNLLQGNTLGLTCSQYYPRRLPRLLVKEYCFDAPKL